MAAEWPGNARELENVVSRATLRASAGRPRDEALVLEPEQFDLPLSGVRAAARAREEIRVDDTLPLSERTREFQRQCIEAAVQATDGNWAAAARQLGMHRSNLHHLARKLGLRG